MRDQSTLHVRASLAWDQMLRLRHPLNTSISSWLFQSINQSINQAKVDLVHDHLGISEKRLSTQSILFSIRVVSCSLFSTPASFLNISI